ncbi:hypothetical protein ACIQW4_33435 [Streptomyces albogriseolus]|uniref:hypothetical protein n=1 Tax=Streptomyces albogriseolus TaxID=1887 RepID=UPI00380BBB58
MALRGLSREEQALVGIGHGAVPQQQQSPEQFGPGTQRCVVTGRTAGGDEKGESTAGLPVAAGSLGGPEQVRARS